VEGAAQRGQPAVEAGARRFALTLGRAWELALLVDQAAWASKQGDRRPGAAARRFARNGVDLLVDEEMGEDARLLLED
jgi:acyl-CoA dehydrogenase